MPVNISISVPDESVDIVKEAIDFEVANSPTAIQPVTGAEYKAYVQDVLMKGLRIYVRRLIKEKRRQEIVVDDIDIDVV